MNLLATRWPPATWPATSPPSPSDRSRSISPTPGWCAPGPTAAVLNESLSTTATVDDEVSGPAADLVSAPVDTRMVRVRQVGLTGYDRAGRSGTASCEVRRHHPLTDPGDHPEHQLQTLRAYAAIDFEG
jgi:hypothetical protein